MTDLRIDPVVNRRDLHDFIELPWLIYRDEPQWTPPIKSELKCLLNPAKHPFWKAARRQMFLARRGREVVGRIVAIVDDHAIRHFNQKIGAWGFFEARRDHETAKALFAKAEEWLKSQGMTGFLGPFNPSVNYEIGLLIQGFDSPPALGLTYNPPYYHELVRAYGQVKEKDLVAYRFERGHPLPERVVNLSESLAQKDEFTFRTGNPKEFMAEVRLINQIYNECWSANWGAIPMMEEEVSRVAEDLKHFIDPELIFFIYHRGEPVGVGLILPDVNPLLRRLNGRGGLIALAMRYLYWSDVNGLRGYIMGIKEEYRQMGLPFLVFHHFMKTIEKKTKYQYMEVGWNLEDNHDINTFYEEFGGRISRRYRIYRKDFA